MLMMAVEIKVKPSYQQFRTISFTIFIHTATSSNRMVIIVNHHHHQIETILTDINDDIEYPILVLPQQTIVIPTTVVQPITLIFNNENLNLPHLPVLFKTGDVCAS
ncbi:hypothetical protein ACTFIV_011287 [Dictyostelium citrinum]